MFANKILNILITITSVILIPIQLVSTFVLGLLVEITFGLPLIIFSLVWVTVFYIPLLCISFAYEQYLLLRPITAAIGVPLAVLAHAYVAMLPSMGETEGRYLKLIYCEVFPYTYRFDLFYRNKLKVNDGDILHRIFNQSLTTDPLNKVITKIVKDNRPSFDNDKHRQEILQAAHRAGNKKERLKDLLVDALHEARER